MCAVCVCRCSLSFEPKEKNVQQDVMRHLFLLADKIIHFICCYVLNEHSANFLQTLIMQVDFHSQCTSYTCLALCSQERAALERELAMFKQQCVAVGKADYAVLRSVHRWVRKRGQPEQCKDHSISVPFTSRNRGCIRIGRKPRKECECMGGADFRCICYTDAMMAGTHIVRRWLCKQQSPGSPRDRGMLDVSFGDLAQGVGWIRFRAARPMGLWCFA